MNAGRIAWSIVGLLSVFATTRASGLITIAECSRSDWRLVLVWVLAFLAFTNPAKGGACQLQELLPADADQARVFGSSVFIDGDQAIVGDTLNGKSIGAAYIFRFDDNDTPTDPTDDRWVEQGKLVPSGGEHNANFAWAVAIHSDWAVVGSPEAGTESAGAVYVFRRDRKATPLDPADDSWTEHGTLPVSGLSVADRFGAEVAVYGDWIVVGAYLDDDVCPDDRRCDSGAAYVFHRNDNGTPGDLSDDRWVQERKLTASDAAQGDHFGSSVSINGARILIASGGGHGPGGSAYVFRRDENGTPLAARGESHLTGMV